MSKQCDGCGKEEIRAQLCSMCLLKFIATIKRGDEFYPEHLHKLVDVFITEDEWRDNVLR